MAYQKENMHKYQMLEAWIEAMIRDGQLLPGQKLLSENQLSSKFQMSRQTVRQALASLEKKGLTESRKGSGTYVALKKRAMVIAYIVSHISSYIFPDIARGVESVISKHGYAMSLYATYDRPDREKAALERLIEQGVDGLIVEGTRSALPNPNIALYESLKRRHIPVVFVSGYYAPLDPVYIVTDDEMGIGFVFDHLYQQGHRRMGAIFKADDLQGHRRYLGFMKRADAMGLKVSDEDVMWYTNFDAHFLETNEQRERFIDRMRDCTAIICYNDQIAIRVIKTLQARNLCVPDDVSVTGYDNSVFADFAPVPVTSVTHPGESLGQHAAEKLLDMIRAKDEGRKEDMVTTPSLIMPVSLVLRASTGRASEKKKVRPLHPRNEGYEKT